MKDGALGGMCVGDIIIGDMLPTAKRGEPAGTLRGEWPGEQGPTRYVLRNRTGRKHRCSYWSGGTLWEN